MQPPPTLADILYTLSEKDYVEYLSINLCGTIDDTSHNITYKKNRKNAGTLTVLEKTTPADIRPHYEYEYINGRKLIIDDMDYFNSIVMDYLRECSFNEPFNSEVALDIWFGLYIRFSNKAIIRLPINTPYMVERTLEFYKCLENYDELLFEFKTIPDKVKELLKNSHYKEGAFYQCKWNGYRVFSPDYSDLEGTVWGEPQFVLYNDNETRWATLEERDEIWSYNNKK